MSSYHNSLEYLLDKLKIINHLLYCRISELHKSADTSESLFHGLAISEERVSETLRQLNRKTTDEYVSSNNPDLKNIIQQIEQKKNNSIKNNIPFSLELLIERFSLSQLEERIILASLAPEIDSSYEIIFAYLQDHIAKRRPSINFVLDLVCSSTHEKLFCKKYLSNSGKLHKFGIIKKISTDPSDNGLNETIILDQRIVTFLLGDMTFDSSMGAYCEFFTLDKKPMPRKYLDDIKQKIFQYILNKSTYKDKKQLLCFCGPNGVGKKSLAHTISNNLNKPLLCIDIGAAFDIQDNLNEMISKISREAVLNNCFLYIHNFDLVLADPTKKIHFQNLINTLKNSTELISFGTTKNPPPEIFYHNNTSIIFLQPSTYMEQKQIWKSFLQNKISDDIVEDLTSKYDLSHHQIESAYVVAQNLSWSNKQNSEEFLIKHLYDACKAQYQGKIGDLTTKISSTLSWDDLILPSSKKEQLLEIISHVKNKNKILSEWGFNDKITSNKGLNVLFHGQSGTGKTMAASVIAKELDLDLYKINLASILSKYIGETEKNLDKIFSELRTSNSILFFDEADSLFGKRTELKDSHDRYANIEVSYLLQKLEEHNEIVILATNFLKNMDDAFLRRMQFMIEFPFPNKSERLKIWKNTFPKTCPITLTDLDYYFLSENFDLSGGNIKNIALSAAFFASGESYPINMKHIILAIKREYEKIGKSFNKAEFGEYYSLIQNT